MVTVAQRRIPKALEYDQRVRLTDDPIRHEADCSAEVAGATTSYVVRMDL